MKKSKRNRVRSVAYRQRRQIRQTGFTILKSGFVVTSNYDRATRWLDSH
jgi:hypothetical protein